MASHPQLLEDQHRKVPVHGFVLAGGQSSRMGQDKALLPFRGRPMVEIAVAKLRSFCAAVSIVGNRPDLEQFAPVVFGERVGLGPGAGIAAGLQACVQPWAMFMPVDVPLVPAQLLRLWVDEALRVDMTVSFLAGLRKQPAFCLLRREREPSFTAMLDMGERSLELLLNHTADQDHVASWMYESEDLYGYPGYRGPSEAELELWFRNINTPQELRDAEALDQAMVSEGGPATRRS